MTDNEINIAIAKICGWSQCEPKVYFNFSQTVSHAFIKDGAYYGGLNSIPDYCNDLNAMHEAEKTLFPHRMHTYCDYLRNCADGTFEWYRIHTTARQRAEAFLKTLNLWKS